MPLKITNSSPKHTTPKKNAATGSTLFGQGLYIAWLILGNRWGGLAIGHWRLKSFWKVPGLCSLCDRSSYEQNTRINMRLLDKQKTMSGRICPKISEKGPQGGLRVNNPNTEHDTIIKMCFLGNQETMILPRWFKGAKMSPTIDWVARTPAPNKLRS